MPTFTREELNEAHRALLSTLKKCEKIDLERQTKPQQPLLVRRMHALRVALVLIEKEQETLQ